VRTGVIEKYQRRAKAHLIDEVVYDLLSVHLTFV
jgi:hypothetical protein